MSVNSCDSNRSTKKLIPFGRKVLIFVVLTRAQKQGDGKKRPKLNTKLGRNQNNYPTNVFARSGGLTFVKLLAKPLPTNQRTRVTLK
jgi:hypothetical protein